MTNKDVLHTLSVGGVHARMYHCPPTQARDGGCEGAQMRKRQCIPNVCRATHGAGDQDEAVPCEGGDARAVLVRLEFADRAYGLRVRIAARGVRIPGVETDATDMVANEDKARLGLLILDLDVRPKERNDDGCGSKVWITECCCLDVACGSIDLDTIEVCIVLICYQNGGR